MQVKGILVTNNDGEKGCVLLAPNYNASDVTNKIKIV